MYNNNERDKMKQKKERLHKYIGFHNTEQVCNSENTNKDSAKKLCEDMLLTYFHELHPTVTPLPSLENYNGEVAYVGSTSLKGQAAKIKREKELGIPQRAEDMTR